MNLDTDALVLPLILHFQPAANDPLHPAAVIYPSPLEFYRIHAVFEDFIYAHLPLNQSNLDTRLSLGSNFDLRSIIKFAWAKPQEILSRVVTHISSYMLYDFKNQLVEKTAVLQPPHPNSPCSNQPSQCPAHVLPNTAAMGLGHSEGWAQAMLFAALPQCLEDGW